MILKRQIFAAGGSRAWLNGKLVPLKILEKLGEKCCSIHRQGESSGAFATQRLVRWYDGAAKVPKKLADEVKNTYKNMFEIRSDWLGFSQNVENQEECMALLDWRLGQLKEAELKSGEEDRYRLRRKEIRAVLNKQDALHKLQKIMDESRADQSD